LTKQKGTFIALKGASAEEEEKDAEKAVKILGGEISRKESLQLPEEESQRHLIFISKVKTTPNKYPRKPGTPAKFPL
jgi:16S rRNA (guanine527-N7)-methyltransferase